MDDEEKIRTIVAAVLTDEGYDVRGASNGIEALEMAAQFHPHLLIVDLQMPRVDGIETIARFKERFPKTLAVILTAHGSIQSAVQAIKQGAYDYLTKPFDNDHMLLVVRRAIELSRLSAEVDDLRDRLQKSNGIDRIVGTSTIMDALRRQILQIAQTEATVLIEGESGTGKELTARAIHYESRRKNGPLVIVDCAAIPPSLIESEFFGHEKGAFTDAQMERAGRFQEADTGTVFLDEVGELPLEAQTKLLRILQEREFFRVGGNVSIKVDVRVIAATNKDLEAQVKAGKFREDLYYRLNVLKLCVPPLREHREDIPLYVDYFMKKYKDTFGTTVIEVSDEALDLLTAAEWRGNIRELENVVQRALMNARGKRIEISNIDFYERKRATEFPAYRPGDSLEAHVNSIVTDTERNIILQTLNQTHWNRTETAERLKISRKTLFNKMQQYGLDLEEQRQGETKKQV